MSEQPARMLRSRRRNDEFVREEEEEGVGATKRVADTRLCKNLTLFREYWLD